ncbi:MAG: 6,7-dimethyl-8-ribityllumazine synthase [Flavobacteriaceae bacterium]
MATGLTNLSEYESEQVPDGSNFSIHLVVSQWNDSITSNLSRGAYETLIQHGVKKSQIKVWNVPGSFELVYGSKKAQAQNPDAIIAIGSVIQGETKHFDFVCEAVSQGIKDLNILSDVPVIFCVLTDSTFQQAVDRSGGKHGNKGVEAAVAALQIAALRACF